MSNTCFDILRVCNCSGSQIGLQAPSTGEFVLEFYYLEKYWRYDQDLVEGDEITMPVDFNSDSFPEFRILKNDVYQEIDEVSKWILKITECTDASSQTPTSSIPYSFEYILADQTGSTIDLSGVEITTDSGVVTINEDLFDTYRVNVYKNGGRQYEPFHYTLDEATQIFTFVMALDADAIIFEFIKK